MLVMSRIDAALIGCGIFGLDMRIRHIVLLSVLGMALIAHVAPVGAGPPTVSGNASTQRHWLLVSVLDDIALAAAKGSASSPESDQITFTSENICVEYEFRIKRHAPNAEQKPCAGIWQAGIGRTVKVQIDESGELSYRHSVFGNERQAAPKTQSGFDPTKWRKMRIERRRGEFVVTVDNRVVATDTWAEQDKNTDVATGVFASQCDAEFRNIRLYVESAIRGDNGKIAKALASIDKRLLAGDIAGARKAYEILVPTLGKTPNAENFFDPIRKRFKISEAIMSRQGLQLDRAAGWKICGLGPDCNYWSLKSSWLIGKPPPEPKDPGPGPVKIISMTTRDLDGREMNVSGTVSIPVVLPAYEISGLIDRDTSLPESSVQFHWNQSYFHMAHPWVEIQPKRVVLYVGCRKGRGFVKKIIAEAKLPSGDGPLRFCIRIDRNKAAVFIKDGSKPLLKSDSLPATGQSVMLHYQHFPNNKRPRFGRLRIGHTPKTARITSPVELPRALPAN
jgi:hypothetical protein